MADYAQAGNRWTMILVRRKDEFGREVLERATFDLVRFNVDTFPNAEQYIIPVSGTDKGKIFERIWTVDEQPYKVQFFGGQE